MYIEQMRPYIDHSGFAVRTSQVLTVDWNRHLTNEGLAVAHTSMEKIYVAQEVIDEWCGRAMVQFISGTDLFDPPLIEHYDSAGEFERFLLIVCDEDARYAEVFV